MKFYLIVLSNLCFALFSNFSTKSQETSSAFQPFWSVGLSSSYNNYGGITTSRNFDHKYDVARQNIRVGADLTRIFTERSAITTGLYYYNVGYNAQFAFYSNELSDPTIPHTARVKLAYLDIPAMYRHRFIGGDDFELYGTGGMAVSFLISNTSDVTYIDYSARKLENVQSGLASVQFGLGMQYNFMEKFGVTVEPQIRAYMSGFDPWMNQQPWVFFGKLGIVYEMN